MCPRARPPGHAREVQPGAAPKCFRIGKKDRLPPDPFTIQEAETIIAAIHHDWGQAHYEEFRIFTGMRPSAEIALEVADCDLTQGKVMVSKARVMRHDTDRTKPGEDRLVELCPRALEVLKRQLALRAKLKLAGKVTHENVFFRDDGSKICNLNDPSDGWRWSLKRLKVRYRAPYSARHSSASWNLMAGKNIPWVAKQHGAIASRPCSPRTQSGRKAPRKPTSRPSNGRWINAREPPRVS